MDKQEVKCMTYFVIKGTFKLEEIEEILKMKCTKGWNIGDENANSGKTLSFSSWQFGTDYEETIEFEEQLQKVIAPLSLKIEELNYILEKYDCYFTLEHVQDVSHVQSTGIFLNEKIIDFCSKTKTSIDIDIYPNYVIN